MHMSNDIIILHGDAFVEVITNVFLIIDILGITESKNRVSWILSIPPEWLYDLFLICAKEKSSVLPHVLLFQTITNEISCYILTVGKQ